MLSKVRASDGMTAQSTRHRRGPLAPAAFLLSMLLVGGCAQHTDDDRTGDDGQARPSAPAATGSGTGTASAAAEQTQQPSGTSAGRPAGCSTDDTDQAVPTRSPADLRWMTYRTDLLPASPTAGPLKVEGPVWSCFARTPLGGVLAIHAIWAKMGGSDWKAVTEKQMARGPGRDQLVAKRSELPDDDKTGAPGSDGTYLGFRFLTASKDQVTAMILMRLPDGRYAAGTASAVWEDGDWKLRPTLTGSISESITPVGGTDGFVLWGAGKSS
ncbi:hypothetical protein DEJ51_19780 [Streptomyces venezuelae]|uniref:DUF8175 domain-containing protein n=1 Tax=Streptomyces venezuelae TaxID=54571 RepID=A0A5P2DLX8_STRVZ|nr:hypothetical protein [Streptomyces venezuelae]QES56122.1 hypothetical protein DEJ51_19780 [Streptomyces venezuelae]